MPQSSGMKVLLVSNQNGDGKSIGNPILYRMMCTMREDERIEQVDFMPFKTGKTFSSLRQIAKAGRSYDLIHVHFGGIYALLVWFATYRVRVPKFITFHGTDIHAKAIKSARSLREKVKIRLNQWASFVCIMLFDRHGYVAEEMRQYVPRWIRQKTDGQAFIQPLGVDYQLFTSQNQQEAQRKLGVSGGKKVLFSDVSNTSVKRRDLAEKIVGNMGEDYQLLLMSGVSPDDVPTYVNACDLLLLTSDEEGSPNIIRECLALNKRVYSVDVGDARRQLQGLTNSLIISRDPNEAAQMILQNLEKDYTDDTRTTRRDILDFRQLNKGVISLYDKALKSKSKAA